MCIGASKQPPGLSLLVVFDDETMGGKAKNVDVAFRVQGCGDNTLCQFALTHVYWS